MTILT